MSSPLIIKFGGDALASPERIALAARRVARRLERSRVVAVASARRGVTDHLLGLIEQVKEDTASDGSESRGLAAASDRAVAAGELVAASLLSVALNRLGIPAEVLDAREAGLHSSGEWTRARITRVRPARISRLLQRGITPVITGFQGWYRGQVTTLGRGGSDTTAVSLEAELGAFECELVKHSGGLFTADPKVIPQARLIPQASHRFLSQLAQAGAKVMSLRAAALAEQARVPLRFSSLHDESLWSEVGSTEFTEVKAIALRTGRYRFTARSPTPITASDKNAFAGEVATHGIHAELEAVEADGGFRLDLIVDPDDLEPCLVGVRRLLPHARTLALVATGLSSVTIVGQQPTPALVELARESGGEAFQASDSFNRVSFLVPDASGSELVQALHTVLFSSAYSAEDASYSEAPVGRRAYVRY